MQWKIVYFDLIDEQVKILPQSLLDTVYYTQIDSRMPNKLTGSTSPYLLQHQNNPVDWYPWDNSLLVLAYLDGYLLTGDSRYRSVVCETLDYVLDA